VYSSDEVRTAILAALALEVPPGTEQPELYPEAVIPVSPDAPNWKLSASSARGYPYPAALANVVARVQATHRLKVAPYGRSTFQP
jgi:hypothetical protein